MVSLIYNLKSIPNSDNLSAVQVDVKKLGAHLEAYVNLLPAIETLRLGHRYGRGTTCMISELPAELITWIEDLLIAEERRRLLREWADDLRCYEQFCDRMRAPKVLMLVE